LGRLRGFGDGSAGPPRTLAVRRGRPMPATFGPAAPVPVAAPLPLDWRVALANAAGSFVDAIARSDDPLDREAAAGLRIRSAADKNNPS